MKEVKIFYNVYDDKYYMYYGEDFIIDTTKISTVEKCMSLVKKAMKNALVENNMSQLYERLSEISNSGQLK